MQPAPQVIQLMSKHRVLSLKPQLRLEWRDQDGQKEQPYHSVSLGDSIAASRRIGFSVHTAWRTARIGLANIKKQVERRFASTAGIDLRVDPEKCQGHAHCSALAPELFQLDEFGNARERLASCSDPALIEKAYIARANCPEEAIVVIER